MKLLTTPIVKVADLPAGIELGPDEWATAAVALSALILAFMYFALGWSTNRMDATHSARFPSRGSPALICWTSAAGLLSFAILGTHFFAPMFFALNSNLYIWHILPFFAMLYLWFYFWRCMIKILMLHRRYRGNFEPFSDEMLKSIHDYRQGLWPSVFSILIVGWFTFFETLLGDFVAGIMGICFFFVAIAGLGCYISLSGDLFPRAVKEGSD